MKAQISMEFMVGITILLLIYVVTMSVFSSYSQYNVVSVEQNKQICYNIASAIDSAVIGGNGFSSKLEIPYRTDSENITIFVYNTSTITIDYGKNIFACTIVTQNITNVIFEPCKFSVANINNTIYLAAIRTSKTVYSVGQTVEINGSYYIGNVTLTVYNKTNMNVLDGYPQEIEVIENTFYHDWTPSMPGSYELHAVDTLYKNLNSKKDVDIT